MDHFLFLDALVHGEKNINWTIREQHSIWSMEKKTLIGPQKCSMAFGPWRKKQRLDHNSAAWHLVHGRKIINWTIREQHGIWSIEEKTLIGPYKRNTAFGP